MARIKLSPLLADIQGSVGSLCFANTIAGTVLKAKPHQLKSKTPSRQASENHISHARNEWHSLSDADKAKWASMAKLAYTRFKHLGSRKLNGYTYFLRYFLTYMSSGINAPWGFDPDFYLPEFPSLTASLTSADQNFFVAASRDNNTLAYSSDGENWVGLGKSIFSTAGSAVCKYGSWWLAGGAGTNTMAYSANGMSWAALSASPFSERCTSFAYNNKIMVAAGGGTHSLAYSYDGFNWYGLGTSIFSGRGITVCWTGHVFNATGEGGNTLAYSYDGINWVGLGSSIFSVTGFGLCASRFGVIACGRGGHVLAFSRDGIKWSGLKTSLFTVYAKCAAFNGRMFLAGGRDGNSMAYSYDGRNWYAHPSPPFPNYCNSITWNGAFWMAVGSGTSTIAKSYDGFSWSYHGAGLSNIYGYDIAGARELYKYPARLSALTFAYDQDLWGIELWGRLKMSPVLKPGQYPSRNLLKTLKMPYATDFNRDVSAEYYSKFGTLPLIGERVAISSAIFGLDSASLYPELFHDLIVT